MTEVAGEAHDAHVVIVRLQIGENPCGAVAAAIIDVHDLVTDPVDPLEDVAQTAMRLRKDGFLVVARYDDR